MARRSSLPPIMGSNHSTLPLWRCPTFEFTQYTDVSTLKKKKKGTGEKRASLGRGEIPGPAPAEGRAGARGRGIGRRGPAAGACRARAPRRRARARGRRPPGPRPPPRGGAARGRTRAAPGRRRRWGGGGAGERRVGQRGCTPCQRGREAAHTCSTYRMHVLRVQHLSKLRQRRPGAASKGHMRAHLDDDVVPQHFLSAWVELDEVRLEQDALVRHLGTRTGAGGEKQGQMFGEKKRVPPKILCATPRQILLPPHHLPPHSILRRLTFLRMPATTSFAISANSASLSWPSTWPSVRPATPSSPPVPSPPPHSPHRHGGGLVGSPPRGNPHRAPHGGFHGGSHGGCHRSSHVGSRRSSRLSAPPFFAGPRGGARGRSGPRGCFRRCSRPLAPLLGRAPQQIHGAVQRPQPRGRSSLLGGDLPQRRRNAEPVREEGSTASSELLVGRSSWLVPQLQGGINSEQKPFVSRCS